MVVEGSVDASLCAQTLLRCFRERVMPVVHVQHLSTRAGAAFLLPGTYGARFHAHVTPLGSETVIEKNYPNSFRNTRLLDHLRTQGIRDLVIGGMMTHMCVDATVRAAFDFGFHCTVASDACATRALAFGDKVVPADHVHAAFLAALHAVYATVVATEGIVSGLH